MTTVRDLGERRIIQHIMKHLSQMPGTILPNWEDASALSLGDGRALVINTDMLVWQTDIPKGMTSFQAARKCVVMTVSDLGAKGVQPIAFMSSLAVPRNYKVSEIEELSKGRNSAFSHSIVKVLIIVPFSDIPSSFVNLALNRSEPFYTLYN